MDKIEINPRGVCCKKIFIEVNEGIIENVSFLGGCPGNTVGVSLLLKGMKVEDAIARLEGIKCGFKQTSCPNELVKGIKEYYKK